MALLLCCFFHSHFLFSSCLVLLKNSLLRYEIYLYSSKKISSSLSGWTLIMLQLCFRVNVLKSSLTSRTGFKSHITYPYPPVFCFGFTVPVKVTSVKEDEMSKHLAAPYPFKISNQFKGLTYCYSLYWTSWISSLNFSCSYIKFYTVKLFGHTENGYAVIHQCH